MPRTFKGYFFDLTTTSEIGIICSLTLIYEETELHGEEIDCPMSSTKQQIPDWNSSLSRNTILSSLALIIMDSTIMVLQISHQTEGYTAVTAYMGGLATYTPLYSSFNKHKAINTSFLLSSLSLLSSTIYYLHLLSTSLLSSTIIYKDISKKSYKLTIWALKKQN